jgi:hypothetical protein
MELKLNDSLLIGDDHLASRIQMVFAKTEMTATKVATDLDVSVSAVTKWLRTGRVARENLIEFSLRYEIDLIWLMTGGGLMSANEDQRGARIPRIRLSKIYSTLPRLDVLYEQEQSLGYEYVSKASAEFPALVADCEVLAPAIPAQSVIIFQRAMTSDATYGDIVLVVQHDKHSHALKLFVRQYGEVEPGVPIYRASNNLWPQLSGKGFEVIGIATEIRFPLPRHS